LHFAQGHSGQNRASPSPKILGGDIPVGDLFQISVYVTGRDVLGLPVVIHVLQQLLTGQFLAGPDDLRDASISHAQGPLLPALTGEAEADLTSINRYVAILQRGEPVAIVLLGVVVVSDPDERRFQQVHDGGQHLFTWKATERHVLTDLFPYGGKSVSERNNVLVFRAFPDLTKPRVVAILFSSFGIPTGRLNVAIRIGADPNIGPSRRYSERRYARQIINLGQLRPVSAAVVEAPPRFYPPDSRPGIRHVPQAHSLGRTLRVNDRLHIGR
jgi:hypothetical protein